MKTLKEAYEAGKDAVISGANKTNCHFSFFATRELADEWERGRDDKLKTLKGWIVGKTKMKDWKASVRTWEKNTPA